MLLQSNGPWSLGSRATWREPREQPLLTARERERHAAEILPVVDPDEQGSKSSSTRQDSQHLRRTVKLFLIALSLVLEALNRRAERHVLVNVENDLFLCCARAHTRSLASSGLSSLEIFVHSPPSANRILTLSTAVPLLVASDIMGHLDYTPSTAFGVPKCSHGCKGKPGSRVDHWRRR